MVRSALSGEKRSIAYLSIVRGMGRSRRPATRTASLAGWEANRAKDLLFAMLSHELRTPLTAMLTWAQMLRRVSLSEEKTARALALIEKSAK